MSSVPAVIQPSGLTRYDAEQQLVLRDQVAPGCSAAELSHFAMVCHRTGLDPFARQIYAIKRQGKMTIQVSIDGMRLQAQRSGKYRGQTAAEWCGQDGAWQSVWLSRQAPAAARVGVYHADFAQPLIAVARWDSYQQTSTKYPSAWDRMPDVMLAKCAEALALRKAFPAELSGLYTTEEMHQADAAAQAIVLEPQRDLLETGEPAVMVSQVPRVDRGRIAKMVQAFERIDLPQDELELWLGYSLEEITLEDVQQLQQVYQQIRGGKLWGDALAERLAYLSSVDAGESPED